MKAEERAVRPRPARLPSGWPPAYLTGPVRRLPQRLRDWRFWAVQGLVLMITVVHWELESTEALGEHEALSFVPVSFYFIPIVYAGLNFGMEGALPTALWSAALAQPNVLVWHTGLQRFGEELQLAIMVAVAIVVARRVDEERRHRRRAEGTSASLSLLNEIGGALSHTMEVEAQLPGVLQRLLASLSLQSVWLCLEPDSKTDDVLVVVQNAGHAEPAPSAVVRDLHGRVASARGAVTVEGRTVAVPLLIEEGVLGSLGAIAHSGEGLAGGQVELLRTVAHQIAVAVENARLYRQRQESLQSYARQVTQAQEEERLRIARDLHDETAQELVGLVRGLERLDGPANPGRKEAVDELLTRARAILQSVRGYSRDLRPSVLDDLGLMAAIEMVVDDTSARLPGGARLRVRGKPRRVDGAIELALFRIAQEALRNVEKHAGATSALVEVGFTRDAIRLCIADEGVGFSPPARASDLTRIGKLGLLGMKERAELVGGLFELRSAPGGGTQIQVKVEASDRPAA